MRRRQFLHLCGASGLLLAAQPALCNAATRSSSRIDRMSVVRRHNPDITQFDPCASWSLGNGEFAYTADLTGLQTLSRDCAATFPLCTTAHWAWHTSPMPADLLSARLRLKDYDVHGRKVGYRTEAAGQEKLFNYLRTNPHRLHLGEIAFIDGQTGTRILPADIRDARQTLDLWTGVLRSRFTFKDHPVEVETTVHPEKDLVAVSIQSALLSNGGLAVEWAFPYGSPEVSMADWKNTSAHASTLSQSGANAARIARKLDETTYEVAIEWSPGGRITQAGEHRFVLRGAAEKLEIVSVFQRTPSRATLPSRKETAAASTRHWRRFWSNGGAIDLSGSTDPRAATLERRTIHSLYQTAIHCAGSLPSAETGLLFNSWYGKFHLEMHWWHSVHFTAWNRFPLFERSLGLYRRILPAAFDLARSQGYVGARWPKMIGPEGIDSPSPVGPLLIWQQPHPIYYAELCHRERPSRRTLDQWKEIVFATADFMADYAVFDRSRQHYVLGPPMKTVSENTDPLEAFNPAFELSYWRFGLRIAQTWRERLGLPRSLKWDDVLNHLAPLPNRDGAYLLQENLPDTFVKWNWEHPALIGMLGMLPGDGVDPAIMRQTVRKVWDTWQWDRTWGWDFGMMAMAAARTQQPEIAVDVLSLDVSKNKYWPNGHNYQRPGLTAYLPGNGSLLCAIAMMAKGWTHGPTHHAPGFPQTRNWNIKHEDLRTWW